MKYEMHVDKLLKERSFLHIVSGLAAETGEVCALFQKAMYKGRSIPKEDLRLELGDVLFYVTALAHLFGMSLQELQESNLNKLYGRHSNEHSD